jgi:hypothetical protein
VGYAAVRARNAGVVAFGGVLGGYEALPHGFGQAYGGVVVGVTEIFVRPELLVRAGVQRGMLYSEPYWLAVATGEPRVRIAYEFVSAMAGLSFTTAYVRCPSCFEMRFRHRPKSAYGFNPHLLVAVEW